MRAIERLALRAGLPVRFSQGFNPQPRLSLPCPRPVGIAGLDELLVLWLDGGIVGRDDLAGRLNAQAPIGMRFAGPCDVVSGPVPAPVAIVHELAVEAGRSDSLAGRRAELNATSSWPISRTGHADGRSRMLDLRPLVKDIYAEAGLLRWTAVPSGQIWARPAEVLELLGLDGQVSLCRTRRTGILFQNDPRRKERDAPSASAGGETQN